MPKVDAEYICRMENILDLYADPKPGEPVVCVDEHPYQMISETRQSLPAKGNKPERYDYEYKREGVCNLFVFFDFQSGWRHVDVTERRTKEDFALQLKRLVDIYYPNSDKIHVVLDNLNIHKIAVLYEVFEPEEAARIRRRLQFHYTPVHGSWLNMVEIEIGVLKGQCLDRYLSSIDIVRDEVAAWENPRNKAGTTVDWTFTSTNAREKLKRLYPAISSR